jgi:hypothetical protein
MPGDMVTTRWHSTTTAPKQQCQADTGVTATAAKQQCQADTEFWVWWTAGTLPGHVHDDGPGWLTQQPPLLLGTSNAHAGVCLPSWTIPARKDRLYNPSCSTPSLRWSPLLVIRAVVSTGAPHPQCRERYLACVMSQVLLEAEDQCAMELGEPAGGAPSQGWGLQRVGTASMCGADVQAAVHSCTIGDPAGLSFS